MRLNHAIARILAPVLLAALLGCGAATGGACSRCDGTSPHEPTPPVPERPPEKVEVELSAFVPGLSAPDVEQHVTVPLEASLNGISRVVAVTSESRSDRASFVVQFEPGTPLRDAGMAVLQSVRSAPLPDEVHPDIQAGAEDLALDGVLEGPDGARPSLGLLEDIRHDLQRLPGVARVEICGKPKREIRVEVSLQRLAAFGLAAKDVAIAIQRAAPDFPVGPVGGGRAARVQEVRADDLGDAVVRTSRDGVVKLSDVATIRDGTEEPECVCVRNGAPVVCVRVRSGPSFSPAVVRPQAAKTVNEALARRGVGARFEVLRADDATLTLETPPEGREKRAAETAHRLSGPLAKALGDRSWTLRVTEDETTLAVEYASEDEVLAALGALPGVAASPAGRGAAVIRLSSEDLGLLRQHGEALATALRERPDVGAVRVEGAAQAQELNVKPDRERLARLGVTVHDVAAAVRLALVGQVVTRPMVDGREVPVRLTLAGGPAPAEDLTRLSVPAPNGTAVPLGAVASIERTTTPERILRRDGRRAVLVHVWPAADKRLPPGADLAREAAESIELVKGETLTVDD